MTAPQTDAELSTEDVELLETALAKCAQQQPTIRLLDPSADMVWYGMDGDRHFMSLGGHDVLFDPGLALYTPVDPEPIRLLLMEKLKETHGSGRFDWTTVRILSEGDGQIEATVSALSGTPDVPLRIDLAWQITAAEPEAKQPDGAAAASSQYTGEYLGQYYGSTVFSFEGKGFTLDWSTWDPDRISPDGVVGSAVEATRAGAPYHGDA